MEVELMGMLSDMQALPQTCFFSHMSMELEGEIFIINGKSELKWTEWCWFLQQPKLLSRELLDLVASHFNLKEKEYFGITFIDDM